MQDQNGQRAPLTDSLGSILNTDESINNFVIKNDIKNNKKGFASRDLRSK